MRVVAPKGSDIGYFKKNGLLHTAPMVDMQLDLNQMVVVDFFDDNTDWQEAMTALDILEKGEDKYDE